MTEENTPRIQYLTKDDIERIHAKLVAWTKEHDSGEPIPSFQFAKDADVDALVETPRQAFFGREAYPTLEEKAAIIFYTVNKRQIFLNGNKRMSTLCLGAFLFQNGKLLNLTSDELTKKALWLAQTEALEFPAIKAELVGWIRTRLVDI